MAFVKATKAKAKLRMAITGPSGSGKTFTALRIAKGIGGKIAVADSEFGSASKYADEFEFDVDNLNGETHPDRFIRAIAEAEREGFDVLILDSLTHAWNATKEVVDKKKLASNSGNGFTAWAEGTKIWEALQDRIQSSTIHIIITARSKTEYSQEVENGKKVVKKLGMAPELRDGTEFAFDVVLDMDCDHLGRVSKTRCKALDAYCEPKPGELLGETLRNWLTDGADAPKYADISAVRAIVDRFRATGVKWGVASVIVGKKPLERWTESDLEKVTQSLEAEIAKNGAQE